MKILASFYFLGTVLGSVIVPRQCGGGICRDTVGNATNARADCSRFLVTSVIPATR